MADKNSTGAVHLTTLDLDISDALQSLQNLNEAIIKNAEEAKIPYENLFKDINFNNIDTSKTSFGFSSVPFEKISKSVNVTKSSIESLNLSYKTFLNTLSRSKLTDSFLGDIPKDAKESADSVEKLTESIRNGEKITKGVQDSYYNLSSELKRLKGELKDTETRANQTGEGFKDLSKKAQGAGGAVTDFLNKISDKVKWLSAYQLVLLVQNAFKQAVSVIKETEDSVVELQRVLNEDISNNVVSKELYDIANEFGQTFESVQEVAIRFAQTGKTWNETIDATRATMLGLNTAELEVSTATEGLIAVMAQFNVDASELESVIDKINITADNFPVTSEKIVAALQRAGGTASAFNMTLEETIATITALAEKTGRSGENIGTALNSLIIFTSKSENLELFSSLSEQMDAVVKKFQAGSASVIDVWKQLNIEIEHLSAEQEDALFNSTAFEEFADTFEAEAAEYAGTIQQIYGTAGAYRRNYLTVLLNDIGTVDEALANMAQSERYSLQENEKYMETLTAKWNQLVISAQELAVQLGEAGILDILKLFTDLGTYALKLTKNIGGLRTAFFALGTVLVLIKKQKIADLFSNLANTILNLKSPVSIATSVQTAYNAALEAGKTKAQALAIACNTLSLSLGNILSIAGIVATAISAIAGAMDAAKQEAREYREEMIQAGKDSETSAQEFANLYKEFSENFGNSELDGAATVKYYNEIIDEVNRKQIDLTKTIYGNIDTNNRQILEWTEENIERFEDELESWGESAKDMLGSISTVYGGSSQYDNIEIAFSPILQTSHGPVFLSRETVDKYIYGLIAEAGEGWTKEDIIKLDVNGLEIDGQRIKNLIADIGATAIKTGEAMHYTGELGAVAMALNDVKEMADSAGVSIEEYTSLFNDIKLDSEEIENLTQSILEYFEYQYEDIPKLISQYGSLENAIDNLIEKEYEKIRLDATRRKEAAETLYDDLEIPNLNKQILDSNEDQLERVRETLHILAKEYENIEQYGANGIEAFKKVPETLDEAKNYVEEISNYIDYIKENMYSNYLIDNPILNIFYEYKQTLEAIIKEQEDANSGWEDAWVVTSTGVEYFELLATREEEAENALKEFSGSVAEFTEINFEEEIENLGEAFDDLSSKVDSFQSSYSSVVNVIEKYNETGVMTADMLQDLLELGPEYISMLNTEGGQLSLNEDAVKKLMAANDLRLQQMTAMKIAEWAEAEATSMATAQKEGYAIAEYAAGAATAVFQGELYNAILAELQGVSATGQLEAAIKNLGTAAGITGEYFASLKNQVYDTINAFSQTLGLIKKEQVKTYYAPKTTSSGSSSNKNNAEKERLQEELNAWKKEKEAATEYYKEIEENLKEQKEESDDYYDELIKRLKEVQEENERINEQMDYYANRQKILTNIEQAQSRSGVEWRQKEMEYQQELAELDEDWRRKLEDWDIEDQISELEVLKQAARDLIDFQLEELEDLRDATLDTIEEEIEKVQELINNLNKNVSSGVSSAIGTALDEELPSILDGLDVLKEKAIKTSEDMMEAFKHVAEFGNEEINATFRTIEKNAKGTSEQVGKMYNTNFIDPTYRNIQTIGDYIRNQLVLDANNSSIMMKNAFDKNFIAPIRTSLAQLMKEASSNSWQRAMDVGGFYNPATGKVYNSNNSNTVNMYANIGNSSIATNTVNSMADLMKNTSTNPWKF